MKNLENERLDSLNIVKKKSWLKSFFVVFLVFVVVGIIIAKAATETIKNYDSNFVQVTKYIEWLNEPVIETELVSSPIKTSNYDSFKSKASLSGFNAVEDGNVNLEKEDLVLEHDLSLTDKELGAFFNNTLSGGETSAIFKLIGLEIAQNVSEISEDIMLNNLTLTAKIDFSSGRQATGLNLNFPNYIYITTQSQVVVIENVLKISNTSVQINKLSESKNQEIISFINNLFGNVSSDYEFSDLIGILVSEQLQAVTEKTGAFLVLEDGGITFLTEEPELD